MLKPVKIFPFVDKISIIASDFKASNIFVVYNSNIKKNNIVVLTCVALTETD